MSTYTLSSLGTSVDEAPARIGRVRFARLGIATVVAATLANVLVYFLGDAVVRYDPDFVILTNPSGIAMFTAIAAAVAVLVYAGISRFSSSPVRTFIIVSAVVFVVTLLPDLFYIPTVEGASNGQTAILILTHVVAAAVIVGMLTKMVRPANR